MPPSLLHLPDELLLLILSFIPAQKTRCPDSYWRKQRRPDVDRLSRCSRRLHAVATPVLYASIAIRDEMPLLLRSFMRNPHLRSYTHSLTMFIPKCDEMWSSAYFSDAAGAELLRMAIEETLRDEVWHQPPPEGWCSGQLLARGFGANAASRWIAAANSNNDHWDAQCALLLALMPGLTHLEMQLNESGLRFNGCRTDRLQSECIAFLMLAAANTQLRTLATAADPARAPQDAAGGVLPCLRYVGITGWKSFIKVEELLPLALPPLIEELRVRGLVWNIYRQCADCVAQMKQMKLNVRNLIFLKNQILSSEFLDFLLCFPKLEKLVGRPYSAKSTVYDTPTMREALKSVAGTLKELDMSEDVWPYYDEEMSQMPSGPLCDFPALEKLSISSERQIDYWQRKQNVPPSPGQPEQMLLGHFPASLKELTVTGQTQAPVLEIVQALSYLLETREVPALQRITVVFTEGDPESAMLDLRRRCEARGIDLALTLVSRPQYGPSRRYHGIPVFHEQIVYHCNIPAISLLEPKLFVTPDVSSAPTCLPRACP